MIRHVYFEYCQSPESCLVHETFGPGIMVSSLATLICNQLHGHMSCTGEYTVHISTRQNSNDNRIGRLGHMIIFLGEKRILGLTFGTKVADLF